MLSFADRVELNMALKDNDGPRLRRHLQARPSCASAWLEHPRRGSKVTPLWLAVEHRAYDVLDVLLDVRAPDRNNPSEDRTAFQYAASLLDERAVSVFESHGKGHPLACTPRRPGRTALACALEKSDGTIPPLVDRWLTELSTRRRPLAPDLGASLIQAALALGGAPRRYCPAYWPSVLTRPHRRPPTP